MTKSKNDLNNFFDKVFIISLYDQVKKFEKVENQFKNRGVKVQRFIAVDGRCKKEGKIGCLDKLKSFEIMFDVTISNKKKLKLQELVPAASLTIGTILLLRKMVKEKWDRILICEDDIELVNGINAKFTEGIKEIGDYKWDILYLGCGNKGGLNGISYEQTEDAKYLSELGIVYDEEFYIGNKNDLRMPSDDSKPFSEHISIPEIPGGTWAYAYSLSGAKKILKLLDNDAGNHIDRLIEEHIESLKTLAFDPPIIYHEKIIDRSQSSIPWEW
jgi:GR25 family glycosyltransferase involved in LPS biosynthesis